MSNYDKCPACGKWVPHGHDECPHCGQQQGLSAHIKSFWSVLFPPKNERKSGALCVACDRLVGVDDENCPYCGVPQTGVRKAARMVNDVLPSTANVTQLTLNMLVILFILPILTMGDLPEFSVADYLGSGNNLALMLMGANYGPLLEYGQYWRLVTATFLHIGAMHIVFNGYALHVLGNPLEALYGRGWFFFMYVLTGVAGNLLSWAANGISFANAGASGSIYGLIGMGISHCWRHRWVNRELLRLLVTWAIFGLVFGAVVKADNWAHIGGLLSGGALAWVLRAEVVTNRRFKNLANIVGLVTVVVVVACFVMALLAAPEIKEAVLSGR